MYQEEGAPAWQDRRPQQSRRTTAQHTTGHNVTLIRPVAPPIDSLTDLCTFIAAVALLSAAATSFVGVIWLALTAVSWLVA